MPVSLGDAPAPHGGSVEPLGKANRWALCVINDERSLMAESFGLRYQVYCVERQFLAATDYPQGLETDEFDAIGVHVGAVERDNHLAGTARLILPVHGTLPTLTHCSLDAVSGPLWGPTARWVEVSRLAVSRNFGRSNQAAAASSYTHYGRSDVLLAVSRAVYLASKRLTATHWLVSIERSLQRLLSRSGFPFRQVGPEFDYLGPVAPYSMDLAEFETIARSGRYPQIADFMPDEETQNLPKTGPADFNVLPALTTRVNEAVPLGA